MQNFPWFFVPSKLLISSVPLKLWKPNLNIFTSPQFFSLHYLQLVLEISIFQTPWGAYIVESHSGYQLHPINKLPCLLFTNLISPILHFEHFIKGEFQSVSFLVYELFHGGRFSSSRAGRDQLITYGAFPSSSLSSSSPLWFSSDQFSAYCFHQILDWTSASFICWILRDV